MLYEYDYQGRRVVKDEGGAGRIYFWDEVFGEVIWEFPLEAPASQDLLRFFFNGRLVAESDARPGAGFHYMHRDHLGTSKLMTEPFSPTVACDEVDHPFGQVQSEQPSSCNAHVRKFTGKERDAESGMDYFGARYYDQISARFMTPDPISFQAEAMADPQRFNLYSYVRNLPLVLVDPTGARIEIVGNEVQREQALEAFRSAVGDEAADLLAIMEEDGRFFLEVVADGKNGAFASLNQVSNSVSVLINDSETIRVAVVAEGRRIESDAGDRIVISRVIPGATGMVSGVMSVFILDTSMRPIRVPASFMSNNRPGFIDPGILIGHELGHAGFGIGAFLIDGAGRPGSSNRSALLLENMVRKLKDPKAPERILHGERNR